MWHRDVASINYIETSTWTRQEHNGFSHQNPSFIGAVLKLKPSAARVYLPPDANTFLTTLHHCLKSKNYINLMVGSKQPTPVYLTPEEAESHCRAGASIWRFCSTDNGLDPDVVLVGIGVEVMFEVITAAAILRYHPSIAVDSAGPSANRRKSGPCKPETIAQRRRKGFQESEQGIRVRGIFREILENVPMLDNAGPVHTIYVRKSSSWRRAFVSYSDVDEPNVSTIR